MLSLLASMTTAGSDMEFGRTISTGFLYKAVSLVLLFSTESGSLMQETRASDVRLESLFSVIYVCTNCSFVS